MLEEALRGSGWVRSGSDNPAALSAGRRLSRLGGCGGLGAMPALVTRAVTRRDGLCDAGRVVTTLPVVSSSLSQRRAAGHAPAAAS